LGSDDRERAIYHLQKEKRVGSETMEKSHQKQKWKGLPLYCSEKRRKSHQVQGERAAWPKKGRSPKKWRWSLTHRCFAAHGGSARGAAGKGRVIRGHRGLSLLRTRVG